MYIHTLVYSYCTYIITIMVAKEVTLIESLSYRMDLLFTFGGHIKLYVKGTIEFGK